MWASQFPRVYRATVVVFLLVLFRICPAPPGFADSLKIVYTYPYHTKTTSLDRMRYAGYTDPQATLYIEGVRTPLSSLGAFVGVFPLSVGKNVLHATAELKGETASANLTITRKSPSLPPPADPWSINRALCLPKRDVWFRAPGALQVRCVGSPGGTATFSVGRIENVPMIERSPGRYLGEIVIQQAEKLEDEEVEFELISADGKTKTRSTSRGTVTVFGTGPPIVLETQSDDPVPLYRTDSGRTRYTDLPGGVRLEAIAQHERRYEVRLAGTRTAFVDIHDVERLPEGTERPRSSIESITTQVKPDRTVIRIPLSQRLPYTVSELDSPPRLDLRIYGAEPDTWWVTRHHTDRTLQTLRHDITPEGAYRLLLGLQHAHWGYLPYYEENTLCLDINSPPSVPQVGKGRLAGLVVAIDPGHGGSNRGARAPTGVYEKTINRKLCDRLQKQLRSIGTETIMLRQGDETVSLQDRVDRARRGGAHILLSVHNNSIGDTTDPLATRGTSTYYYHPHSERLSRTIYDELIEVPEVEPWGHIGEFDFTPIRSSTDMIGVLIECLFVSHPGDEEVVLSEKGEEGIVTGIVKGLVSFLQESERNHIGPKK